MTIKTIEINKNPKTGFFRKLFSSIAYWSLVLFAFYFNYKFIDGNNFLDFIIFILIITCACDKALSLMKVIIRYDNVSDDKIKAIEELLDKD